jgi:hypothetical protein
MSLYDEIVKLYPELKDNKEIFTTLIRLADESDGKGAFIVKWEYDKPLDKSLESYRR